MTNNSIDYDEMMFDIKKTLVQPPFSRGLSGWSARWVVLRHKTSKVTFMSTDGNDVWIDDYTMFTLVPYYTPTDATTSIVRIRKRTR